LAYNGRQPAADSSRLSALGQGQAEDLNADVPKDFGAQAAAHGPTADGLQLAACGQARQVQ